jgi:phosphoglycerol transferase MdoB-like AlkP superfamily enzyme
MGIYQWLYETNNFIFNIGITIIWILIFLSFVNFYSDKTKMILSIVSYYIRIYVCIFLIVRFNPFYSIFTKKKFVFTDLDRKIAYSSGITILTTDINLIQTISDLFNKFNMKS